MAIFNYILSFYFKVVFLISISIFLAYLFLAKETAYYYCDEICITIIQHHQGRDTFFRVYDGIVLSRYSYLFLVLLKNNTQVKIAQYFTIAQRNLWTKHLIIAQNVTAHTL